MDGNGGDHNAHRKTLAGVIRKHTADNHQGTTNLRDLLKVSSLTDDIRENDKGLAGERCMTLADAFVYDTSDSPSSSSSNRKFFDAIRDGKKHCTSTDNDVNSHHHSHSHGHNHNKTQIVNWKTFKNRLLLRHAASSFSDPLNIDTVLPTPTGSAAPVQVSLMTLLDQTDMMGVDSNRGGEGKGGTDGDKNVPHTCGVCMDRHKDMSVLPCGHAFCGVCSTELSPPADDENGGGGKCPLCNGFVLEILNIF